MENLIASYREYEIPGDIISDLHAAGAIANPFFETTWKNSSLWKGNLWTYSTHFASPATAAAPTSTLLLVFDGIKMGAEITLNGQKLGVATDQFTRYRYDVTSLLKVPGENNTLELAFSNAIDTAGRFMTCSGQADWAPYSNTFHRSLTLGSTSQKMPTFSFGIWKSVYLVAVQRAAISARLSLDQPDRPHM